MEFCIMLICPLPKQFECKNPSQKSVKIFQIIIHNMTIYSDRLPALTGLAFLAGP